MLDFIFKKLLPFLKPFKLKIILVFICSIVLASIGAWQVSILKPLFDKGLDPNVSRIAVYQVAGELVLLSLLNFPVRFFHFYYLKFIVEHAICDVRLKLYKKAVQLPISYFQTNKQANVLSIITNDSLFFSHGFRGVADLIRESMKAIAYLSMAFYADWQLTLVILLLTPFLLAIFSMTFSRVKKYNIKIQEENAEIFHNISEGISSQKMIKAFNIQDFVVERFVNSQNKFLKSLMKSALVEELAHPLVELLVALSFSGVIVLAHHRFQDGLTVGGFISFIAALALFMDPVKKFSHANIKLSQGNAAADRIFGLLNLDIEIQGGIDYTKFKNKIKINNLSFSYNKDAQVLKNISLEIKKGSKIAFVGASGSGKSTLVNLLLNMYPVANNSIEIDGIDINKIEINSLRKIFGYVGQDILLFNDTIESNLKLDKDINKDVLKKALDISHASEFVELLKYKEQTKIGDRGTLLSGGQKQRLTIARAFLSKPDIFLFDEATSALDNESEKVVQNALDSVSKDNTVIAVAHRLSTIVNFDVIYVFEEGQILEYGNHQSLMQQKGLYFKLWQLSQS